MQVTAGVDEPPSCSPEGWRRHGPVGRPLDDVRAIRDDIGHRIRSLIADLNDD